MSSKEEIELATGLPFALREYRRVLTAKKELLL